MKIFSRFIEKILSNKNLLLYKDIPYIELQKLEKELKIKGLIFDVGDYFLYNLYLTLNKKEKNRNQIIQDAIQDAILHYFSYTQDGNVIFFKQNKENNIEFTDESFQERLISYTQICLENQEDDYNKDTKSKLVTLLDVFCIFMLQSEITNMDFIQALYKICHYNYKNNLNRNINNEQNKYLIETYGYQSINDILDRLSEMLILSELMDGISRMTIDNLVDLIMFGFDTKYLDLSNDFLEPIYVELLKEDEQSQVVEKTLELENTDKNQESSLVVLKDIGDPTSEEGMNISTRYSYLRKPIELKKSMISENDLYVLLNNEFPWLEEANEHIASSLAMNSFSSDGFYFKPILLNGSPGIGKTKWCSRISELTGIKMDKISFAGMSSSMSVNGTERGFHQARPGFYVDSIKKTECGNPIILIDEVDKGKSGINGDPFSALLPLMERDTAKTYKDNYLLGCLDLSNFSYVLTSNDKNILPIELLDRLICIDCRIPTVDEAVSIIPNILKELLITYKIPETYNLNINEKEAIEVYEDTQSIRSLKNNIEKQFRENFWKPKNKKEYKTTKRKIGFNS
jgi:ATP-dependent Lon protease